MLKKASCLDSKNILIATELKAYKDFVLTLGQISRPTFLSTSIKIDDLEDLNLYFNKIKMCKDKDCAKKSKNPKPILNKFPKCFVAELERINTSKVNDVDKIHVSEKEKNNSQTINDSKKRKNEAVIPDRNPYLIEELKTKLKSNAEQKEKKYFFSKFFREIKSIFIGKK